MGGQRIQSFSTKITRPVSLLIVGAWHRPKWRSQKVESKYRGSNSPLPTPHFGYRGSGDRPPPAPYRPSFLEPSTPYEGFEAPCSGEAPNYREGGLEGQGSTGRDLLLGPLAVLDLLPQLGLQLPPRRLPILTPIR